MKTSLLTLGLKNSISTVWAEKSRFCTLGLYRAYILCESTHRGQIVTHILGYISRIRLSDSGHFSTRYLQNTGPWAQHLICPGTREVCCSSLEERRVSLNLFAHHFRGWQAVPYLLLWHLRERGRAEASCPGVLGRASLPYTGQHRPRQRGNFIFYYFQSC